MNIRIKRGSFSLGLALIGLFAGNAIPGELLQFGEKPKIAVICNSMARDTGQPLHLEMGKDPGGFHPETPDAACLDPEGSPWILRLTNDDSSFLRFSLEALEAFAKTDAQGEITLEQILSLDEVESVQLNEGMGQQVGIAPASDSSCTPLEEARRRLTGTMNAFGLRSDSVEQEVPGGQEYVCIPADSGFALLVSGDGRIGRIGLAPEALERISARALEDPGALLGAFADELPKNLSHLPQDGLQLTLSYRGGQKLNITIRTQNLDYYLD